MRILSIVIVFVIVLALTMTAAIAANGRLAADPEIQNASWIWLRGSEESPNATVCFRKIFELTGKWKSAAIQVTCDDNYKLWVNGTEVGSSSGKEFAWKRADGYDITGMLRKGENLIAIEGKNNLGKAGLIAALAIDRGHGKVLRVMTGSTWQAALKPEEDWRKSVNAQGDWQPCLVYGPSGTSPWMTPRPPSKLATTIERLKVELAEAMVVPVNVEIDPSTTATVSRIPAPGSSEAGEARPGGWTIRATAPGQKAVFVCDFGREIVGYPRILGKAYGDARVSLACGEFEAECLNPQQAAINDVLRMGGIRWAPKDRRAFRYVRFTIEPTQVIDLDKLEAQTVGYPVEKTGSFTCSDDMLNRIYDVSGYTVQLCMQDYYEDGVKRDRMLWVGDLRVEALVNYTVFGDVGLARRGLLQMADLQLADGMIPGMGPGDFSEWLPDYCAYWVMSLTDYYRHTGDLATVKVLYPYLQKQMGWFQTNSDETGMFRHADRPGWWIFVDWDSSLEKKDRVMALEALYHWVLRDAAELAKAVGSNKEAAVYLARASKLRESVNASLWSSELKGYVDCLTDDGPSKLIHRQSNALAILAGLPDKTMTDTIIGTFMRSSRTPPVTTPYMNFYVTSSLFESGKTAMALELIRNYWGPMISRGVTTFWERFDPEWPTPYEDAGMSYCHGWSAGPGYMLPTYVAGVRPMEAGFKKILVSPEMGDLTWVKSTVPTPSGPVTVDLKSISGVIVGDITVPKGCTATVALPSPPADSAYTVDDKRPETTVEGEKITFTLKGGASYTLGVEDAETGN